MAPQVAICIITCKRPEGLARLLDALGRLTFCEDRPEPLGIIVVDNDSSASSKSVCETQTTTLPWPLDYVTEPKRGIPFARNTAFAVAVNDKNDLVAFIDDDEIPEPNWLDELLRVQRIYDADVVAGPVLSDLGPSPPAWAVEGGFYERRRFATGSPIENAFTGNVLFRTRTVTAALGSRPFNEEMALTGGTDAYLSKELLLRGAKMIWADTAIVTETVPPSRMSAHWLLRRAFRAGVSRALTTRQLSPTRLDRLRCAMLGPLHIGRGIARLPLSVIRGKHRSLAAARDAAFGAGLVAGSLGYHYDEYTTVHGS
ncbi:MAG: hypothetical protein A2341_04290 [Deltaproteobacteria bacterium RIFOXYB12_FULL_58_9]|nr:MAG: hypothetical protein A2341_04290 [Deltaproteobacteria bacterium RIFOXYB12_FULL_58_9]